MKTSSEPNTDGVFVASAHEQRKATSEKVARKLTLLAALLLVIPVVSILAYIFIEAWPVLSIDFLWDNPRRSGREGGIWLPLIGTFYLVLISLFIVAPIGIAAGIYINEYAPNNWFTRAITMAVTSLAGVPSIVHGLFGVGAFVYFLDMGKSLMAAACTIAVMTLPVLVTATREALSGVPVTFREACWNLGATRWQTVRTIVLPNSISGILTGVILEISRAAGETAPILFTGATASIVFTSDMNKFAPYYLQDEFMALSYHLHVVAEKITDVPDGVKYAVAAVMIILILSVNSVAIAFRVWLRSRKKW